MGGKRVWGMGDCLLMLSEPQPIFWFYFVLCCILHFCCICIFVICSMGMGGKEVRGYGWLARYSNPIPQPIFVFVFCICICICDVTDRDQQCMLVKARAAQADLSQFCTADTYS